MERRHDDLWMKRLEDVITEKMSYVSWEELYLWYKAQRFGSNTYRDIQTRWTDISGGKHGKLNYIDNGRGWYLFSDGSVVQLPID